jgi:hypothetical protein
MPEQIYKLQPDRTLSLRGFDGFGAAAALHSATPSGFQVSGVFRDPADFAVLTLYDADDFYDHPSIRYLPNFDFTGLTLTFDVAYSDGLMPLDSPKYPTIDWPYLDVQPPTGNAVQIRLFDHAQQVGGDYSAASGQFTVIDNGLQQYDRLTLWYLNYAFDYIVPQVACTYTFTTKGSGFTHTVSVGTATYSYKEKAGDTGAAIASALAGVMSSSAGVSATASGSNLTLRAKRDDGQPVPVSSTAATTTYTLYGVSANTVAAAIASQINGVDWASSGVALLLTASTSANVITVSCARPGIDGNSVEMYAVSKNTNLTTAEDRVRFVNGSSQATWRVTLAFDALGIASVRQMWLTFAPALSVGAAFQATEWQATFSNWSVTGPDEKKRLQVAGPGSVRIEPDDPRCTLSAGWASQAGFYSQGFARVSKKTSDTARIAYECNGVHDLYLGTSLSSNRGAFTSTLDGKALAGLDTALSVDAEVVTRRLLAPAVPAGKHTLVLTHADDQPVYFDFLEAAVPSDLSAPPPACNDGSPALDYSTDHTYKLSPARILWNFDHLGFAGPMNEYVGVFWWNQRVRANASIPSVSVTFDGVYTPGDGVFVEIGGDEEKNIPGEVFGKSVFPNEPNSTIAAHFAAFINATSVAVWAAAQDNVLTITAQSPAPAYSLAFNAWYELPPPDQTKYPIPFTGSLQGGTEGDWVIDPSITPVLNRGARDWHADLFGECKKRNRELTVACSMELVNPPDAFAARFPDGSPVVTDVAFGSLHSTHCAFSSTVLDYKTAVYTEIAGLMDAAGLVPNLQFGEFCWWYFPSGSGMGFYDDETKSLAKSALGHDLYTFKSADDDPQVNGGADATFLRNRLRDHVAALASAIRTAYPKAQVEVLFPYDVNYPHPVGVHSLGGRVLRYINFPAEWQTKKTSGLDRIKMEGLDFGAYKRNLDFAVETMRFPLDFGWPKNSVRYMVPVFNGGCPWTREYKLASSLGIAVNFWAFDHFCIFDWDVTQLSSSVRVMRV